MNWEVTGGEKCSIDRTADTVQVKPSMAFTLGLTDNASGFMGGRWMRLLRLTL